MITFPIWEPTRRFESIDFDASYQVIEHMRIEGIDLNASIVDNWYDGFDLITPLISLSFVDTDTENAIRLMRYLLYLGADINRPNVGDGMEPITVIQGPLKRRNLQLLLFLLSNPLVISPNDPYIVFAISVIKTDPRFMYVVEQMFEHGAGVNALNFRGETPLIMACSLQEPYRSRLIYELVSKGANVNGPTADQLARLRFRPRAPIDDLIVIRPLAFLSISLLVNHPFFVETPFYVQFRDLERPGLLRDLRLKVEHEERNTGAHDSDWLNFMNVVYKTDPEIQSLLSLIRGYQEGMFTLPKGIGRNISSYLFGKRGKRKSRK